jgi:hypothetical protein
MSSTSPQFKNIFTALTTASLSLGLWNSYPNVAKAENYPMETCIKALNIELTERKSLNRIQNDIKEGKWDDLKLFTREYDAGLRGGIMKSAWKQMEGAKKDRGIEIANSFTFDLIGVNKAARKANTADATKYAAMTEQDVKDFYALIKDNT